MDDELPPVGAWSFSSDELMTLSRNGSLPPGYLDALHARQLALHARLHSEIAATFAAAANDPAMLARLNRPLR
jgi:hypothetical protein